MRARNAIWIAVVVVVIVAIAAYLLVGSGGVSKPGQSSPHAIDQSK